MSYLLTLFCRNSNWKSVGFCRLSKFVSNLHVIVQRQYIDCSFKNRGPTIVYFPILILQNLTGWDLGRGMAPTAPRPLHWLRHSVRISSWHFKLFISLILSLLKVLFSAKTNFTIFIPVFQPASTQDTDQRQLIQTLAESDET